MLKATITEVVIHSDKDAQMLQDVTKINLVDEGGGPFITLTQYNENYTEIVIRLDPNEIPILFKNIQRMLGQESPYVV